MAEEEQEHGAASGGANSAGKPEQAARAAGTSADAAGGERPAAPKRAAPKKKDEPAPPEVLGPKLEAALAAVQSLCAEAERDTAAHPGLGIRVPPERLHDVAAALRDGETACAYLACLSAVDRKTSIEVAYHLFNLDDPDVRIILKVDLPYEGDELPEVDSVTDLWPTANWHEREAFDLLGVRFRGHPDLRRILLPESYRGGYPLRKSFVDQRPRRQRLVRPR